MTSAGCATANGYIQWITADDDNGNLNDGTPHMTAIAAAFNRHGIGCSTPTAQNSGCAAGPSTAPSLTVTPGNFSASLSWNSVAGATHYWVFRSEGHAGCNFGKAQIADVTGTSFTDSQVANGRLYSYNVVAVGVSPRAKRGASGPQNLHMALRSNGTNYYRSTIAQDVSYTANVAIWETDPATAAAWVNTAAALVQAGVKSIT